MNMADFTTQLQDAQRAREGLKGELMGSIRDIEEGGKREAKDTLESIRERLRASSTESSSQFGIVTANAEDRKQKIAQYVQAIGEMQKQLRDAQGQQRKLKNESQAEIAGLKQKIREVRDKGNRAMTEVGNLARELRGEVVQEIEKQKKLFREAMEDANRTMVDIRSKVA